MVNGRALILTFLVISQSLAADPRVIDGDTLEINGTTIRIDGIDAPELGQRCNAVSGAWACGDAAAKLLSQLLAHKPVACEGKEIDRYGRVIASCTAGDQDVGATMVRSGHAWAFRKYSDKYNEIEDQAAARQVGLWQARTETAWEFRARKWEEAQQTAPAGCPIKGNISSNGRIYHPPWSPWYRRTRINTEKGERWFCNEAEARAAGWRAPRVR